MIDFTIVESIPCITQPENFVYIRKHVSDADFIKYTARHAKHLYLHFTLEAADFSYEKRYAIIEIMMNKDYEVLFGDDPAPAILQLENNANI